MWQILFNFQLFKFKQLHPEPHLDLIGNHIDFFQVLFLWAFEWIKMILNSIKPFISILSYVKILWKDWDDYMFNVPSEVGFDPKF